MANSIFALLTYPWVSIFNHIPNTFNMNNIVVMSQDENVTSKLELLAQWEVIYWSRVDSPTKSQ